MFEPGSGSQVHDLNGSIWPSGLFWTVPLPDSALTITRGGRRAQLTATKVPVIDSFQILSGEAVPATVSFDVTWSTEGSPQALGSGSSVGPTDPAAFTGSFYAARATGKFTGQELGFSFSTGNISSDQGFAELGTERNGSYL